MSSDSSYSPEVSSLEHSEETNEVKVVLTADIATAVIKEAKGAIEAGEVSEDLLARIIQYYLAITGSDTDAASYSIVEDSAYALFALHAIELLPTMLSSTGPFAASDLNKHKSNITTVRISHMRTVYSSTVRLLARYESASAQEQHILPYLIILITRLLSTAMELCEAQDRETFLQVLYQNAVVAISSTVCLLDIVHAIFNGYRYTGPLEDLYAALSTEEEAENPGDSDSEDQTRSASLTNPDGKKAQRDTKKRKYPLLSLSITQMLADLVTITAEHEEECQKLVRSLWSKYLSQHGRPRLTQMKALWIQRQLIIYVYTKAPRKVLTEMLLGFSKQIVSHIKCCFIGKGQLLFTRSSTKSGKGKNKRTIFDEPTKKKGAKNAPKEDTVQRYRDLCSWVFVASVELSLMVIKACNLNSLIHPYVEICFYYNEVVPSSLRFFPCRVKVLTAMTNLSDGPDSKQPLYIPLLHSIMEMIIEVVKPASSSSNAGGDTSYADSIGKWRSRIVAENAEGTLSGTLLSLKALLLCPKELANTLIYRKTVFYESLNLFCTNITPYLYHPAFPELMYKPTHYLKHLVLSMKEKENLLGHEYKIHYTSIVKPTYMEICMILDGLRRAINRHIALVDAVRLDLRLHTKNLIDGGIPAAMKAIRKRIIDDGFTVQVADNEGSNDEHDQHAAQHKTVPTLAQLLEKYTAIKGERTVLQKEEVGDSKRYKVLDPSDESSEDYETDEGSSDEGSDRGSYKDDLADFDAMEKEDSELSSGSSSGIDLAANFDEDVVNDLVFPNS